MDFPVYLEIFSSRFISLFISTWFHSVAGKFSLCDRFFEKPLRRWMHPLVMHVVTVDCQLALRLVHLTGVIVTQPRVTLLLLPCFIFRCSYWHASVRPVEHDSRHRPSLLVLTFSRCRRVYKPSRPGERLLDGGPWNQGHQNALAIFSGLQTMLQRAAYEASRQRVVG